MKRFTFDPTKHGLARWLGDGIRCVLMDWIWEMDRPATGRNLYREFAWRWKYTTITTTLARLAESGLLIRQRRGRAWEYTPRMSRADWEQAQITAIIASLSLHDAVAVGDDGWGTEGWE